MVGLGIQQEFLVWEVNLDTYLFIFAPVSFRMVSFVSNGFSTQGDTKMPALLIFSTVIFNVENILLDDVGLTMFSAGLKMLANIRR